MGNRLREVLKGEGVTAYRICKDLGMDQGELSRILHEKQNISLWRLEQIAEYLGYKVELVKNCPSRKGGKD